MTAPFDDAALSRYLSGESSPEEQLAIRHWLEADQSRLAHLDRIRDAWDLAAKRTAPSFDIGAMRHNLGVRTGGAHRAIGRRVSLSSASGRRWLIPMAVVSIAAAAIVVLVVPFDRSSNVARSAPLEWKEITTVRGQKADIYLSDGSHVQLAPESRLRFTSPLADKARDVHLEGRALFEVRHDPLRPFRVRTALGVAEDLGTRFDVRQYPGDTTLKVVVAEGLVAMHGETLTAGHAGILTASGKMGVQKGVDVNREIGWSNGRLSFDAIPLREAIRELRRYYDFEFVVADSVAAARRLTASFDTEAPSEVVNVIALSLELRHELHGKTITFRSR